MDEGTNPNPVVNERYGCWLHIGTILGSWPPSQESGTSSKVRKGSWFCSTFCIQFLNVSRCFGGFVNFLCWKYFLEQNFKNFRKIYNFLKTFFNASWYFELSGNFLGAGGGEAPCGGRRPPQEQEARRASMLIDNLHMWIDNLHGPGRLIQKRTDKWLDFSSASQRVERNRTG